MRGNLRGHSYSVRNSPRFFFFIFLPPAAFENRTPPYSPASQHPASSQPSQSTCMTTHYPQRLSALEPLSTNDSFSLFALPSPSTYFAQDYPAFSPSTLYFPGPLTSSLVQDEPAYPTSDTSGSTYPSDRESSPATSHLSTPRGSPILAARDYPLYVASDGVHSFSGEIESAQYSQQQQHKVRSFLSLETLAWRMLELMGLADAGVRSLPGSHLERIQRILRPFVIRAGLPSATPVLLRPRRHPDALPPRSCTRCSSPAAASVVPGTSPDPPRAVPSAIRPRDR